MFWRTARASRARPELPAPLEVLIAGARAVLGRPTSTQYRCGNEDLVLYGQRHGMTTWLPAIARVQGESPDTLACCDQAARHHALRALTQLQELSGVFQQFDRAGLPLILFKGPALAAWLFGDPSARRYGDFDLLIPEPLRERAFDALVEMGFAPAVPRQSLAAIYGSVGAWPLYRTGTSGVDLHWRLAARRFAAPLTARDVFASATSISIAGRAVQIPSSSHAALMLLTHSAKHIWYSLEQTFAIAHLTRRSDIDWTEVRRRSANAGAARACATGLRLAWELLACPSPPPFAREVAAVPLSLMAAAYQALALPPRVFPDRWHVWRAQRASFDSVLDRWNYDVRVIFEPTARDWQALKLRGPFIPLYVPLRAVRLGFAAVQRATARP